MNKKLAMSLTSIGLAVGIMGASTLAWFTSKDSTKANFNTGTVKVAVSPKENAEGTLNFGDNWIPGDEKEREFTIKNEGTRGIYVRVKVDGKWEDEKLNKENVKFDVDSESGWVNGKDGYFYYKEVLGAESNNEVAMNLKALLDGKTTDNDYQDKEYNLDYKVEAIQAVNGSVFDAWPTSPQATDVKND